MSTITLRYVTFDDITKVTNKTLEYVYVSNTKHTSYYVVIISIHKYIISFKIKQIKVLIADPFNILFKLIVMSFPKWL